MDQGRQGRDQVDTAVVQDVRGQRRAAPTSCARLQSWQLSPHACNTGANQGLVADELEGEADQDRREGGEPRTLCRLPNGGGRHPTTNVPGDSAADRGTTAAATTRARLSRVQAQSTGGMRPDASENSQINPSTIVRAARAAGSQPYLPSGFQGRCKIATLHAGFGVIRGMSVQRSIENFRNRLVWIYRTYFSEEERAGLDLRLEPRSYWYQPEVYIGLLAVSFVGAVLTAIYLWSVR